MFDKVIVITDRVCLKQLQDTIYQFDHGPGWSSGSMRTLSSSRTRSPGRRRGSSSPRCRSSRSCSTRSQDSSRRYAVIIDEAHSSQSGEVRRSTQAGARAAGGDDVDEDGDR